MIEALADSDSDSDVDVPDAVGQLAEQFLALHRQGLTPDIEDYCLRYPEDADRIRNLFPTLLMVEQCGVAASGDSSSIKSGFAFFPRNISGASSWASRCPRIFTYIYAART